MTSADTTGLVPVTITGAGVKPDDGPGRPALAHLAHPAHPALPGSVDTDPGDVLALAGQQLTDPRAA